MLSLILNIFILIITFYVLAIICDEYFVESLEKISEKLNLSSEITWATFMAIWSSAPELFTSIFALFTIWWAINTNNSAIWAWTIVWSALFNILVIVWASWIFMNSKKNKNSDKNKVSRQPIVRDLLFYIITVSLLLIVFLDWKIELYETIILVLSYVVYLFLVKYRWKRFNYKEIKHAVEELEEEKKHWFIKKYVVKILDIFIPDPLKWKKTFRITFIVSIIFIALLSHFMVDSAVDLAYILNIPKWIVWLTILAAWTSIPDLMSSIIVAKKWKWDMAIANSVWSNVFDILMWLWFVYFIYLLIYHNQVQYIKVNTHNLFSSIILLFSVAFVLLLYLFARKWKLSKLAWYFFIFVYIVFLWYQIWNIL